MLEVHRARRVGRVPIVSVFTLCVFVSIVAYAGRAGALWAEMSLEELVQYSDLIVMGEVVSLRSQERSLFDVAIIRIEEVIVGKKDLAEVLVAIPSRNATIVSSASISYRPGQRGVWFLRRRPGPEEELYLADHPQRLQPAERAEAVRTLLRTGSRP